MSFDIVDAKVAVGELTDASKSSGVGLITRAVTFEMEDADESGDVKALFRVGAHEIPLEGFLICDTVSSATDVVCGLYRDDESVVDVDALMTTTVDISGGKSYSSRVDILSALGVHERGILPFYEIANDIKTEDVVGHLPNDSYWVCLTFNTDVDGAGTITVVLKTLGR